MFSNWAQVCYVTIDVAMRKSDCPDALDVDETL